MAGHWFDHDSAKSGICKTKYGCAELGARQVQWAQKLAQTAARDVGHAGDVGDVGELLSHAPRAESGVLLFWVQSAILAAANH